MHSASISVKHAVSNASRFSSQAMVGICTITNMHFSDVIFHSANLSQSQFKTTGKVTSHENYHLLRSFVSFGDLRAMTSFVSATSMRHEDARSNTILRVEYCSELYR